jgi:hypothetical protein
MQKKIVKASPMAMSSRDAGVAASSLRRTDGRDLLNPTLARGLNRMLDVMERSSCRARKLALALACVRPCVEVVRQLINAPRVTPLVAYAPNCCVAIRPAHCE